MKVHVVIKSEKIEGCDVLSQYVVAVFASPAAAVRFIAKLKATPPARFEYFAEEHHVS